MPLPSASSDSPRTPRLAYTAVHIRRYGSTRTLTDRTHPPPPPGVFPSLQPFELHNRLLKSDDYLRAKIKQASIDVSDLIYTTHACPYPEIQSRIRAAQVVKDMQVWRPSTTLIVHGAQLWYNNCEQYS